jgi:hypothetical protein
MSTQLIERAGIIMQVDFCYDKDGLIFESVHLLGDDYKPCGPNILAFLDDMIEMVAPDEAAPLLNQVKRELESGRAAPGVLVTRS